MADMLATPVDLASLPGIPAVSDAEATVVLEAATAVVQSVVKQFLVQGTSTVDLLGTIESWFQLPQRPVSAVTVVELDGETVTDYRRHGARLWRACGWQPCRYTPSTVTVTYTHGYAPDDQRLQLARAATLMLAAGVVSNPQGVSSESIGDYSVAYEKASERMQTSPHLVAALRRQYGQIAGTVRQGAL